MANHNLDAERYIVECSRQWAESVVTRETSDLERFVADDFVGIDPEGNAYNKAELISHTRTAPKQYASTHLNEVKVRFFGDAAVAHACDCRNTKLCGLTFHAVLGDGAREVRLERLLPRRRLWEAAGRP
jgi:ketosteroid isomerase-like protein